MARFSGRVMAPNEISGAVGERRPKSARSARPEAMPSGSGSGWSRIAHLLARGEQLLELHHAVQVAEVRELAVHVVADLRPQAGPAQARMLRQLLLLEAVGHHEDRRAGRRVRHGRDGAAHEARVVRDQRELVAFLRVELRDGLGADAALERAEARRPRPGLVLERHPGELFALGRADPRPQARQLGPITDDDATAHDSLPGAESSGAGLASAPDVTQNAPRGVSLSLTAAAQAGRPSARFTCAFAPL